MFNIGIIGTGLMSEIYSDIIVENNLGKLIAVAGNTKDKTDIFAKKYNITSYPDSNYQAMFANHEFDLIIIATPEWVREDPIKHCVENKVHIILEKPFADNMETATMLKNELKNHKKGFKVCHVLRYSPRFFMAKKHLGDKKIIHMDSTRNSNSLRFQRISGSTNPFFWLAPHDIDMMLWLKGMSIKEVFAITNNASVAKDLVSVMVRFTDDSTATFRNIWGFNAISNISKSAYFNIWHENGCIEIDDSDMNIKIFEGNEVYQPDTYEDFHILSKRMGFFRNMLEEMINDLKIRESEVQEELENALHVTQVSEMISRSVLEGRIVSINEI